MHLPSVPSTHTRSARPSLMRPHANGSEMRSPAVTTVGPASTSDQLQKPGTPVEQRREGNVRSQTSSRCRCLWSNRVGLAARKLLRGPVIDNTRLSPNKNPPQHRSKASIQHHLTNPAAANWHRAPHTVVHCHSTATATALCCRTASPMGSEKIPRPAYVVDIDECSGKAVRGTRRSASTREKPKVSHRDSRSDKSKRRTGDAEYTTERAVTAPASRKVDVITTENEIKQERRKSNASSTSSPRKSAARPPSAHKNRSFPKLSMPETNKREDPRHFGIPTPTTRSPPIVSQSKSQQMPQPIPVRPRAVTTQTYPTRPLSYHATYTSAGGYGPPLSASAWANYQPQPAITPSYPPPNPAGYIRYAATPAPPASDYFGSQALSAPERPMSARPLSSRFDPPSRSSSGFGMRDANQRELADAYEAGYYDDAYASASEGTIRKRESIRVPSRTPSRLSKSDADYQAMPPPTRPGILRRPATDYTYLGGLALTEIQWTYDLGDSREEARPRRSNSHRTSASYDLVEGMERVRIETANNGRRRQSYYGQSASGQSTYGQSNSTGSSGYEDKIRQAASYQEDVTGPSVPLTAEVLKRQQRRQAGSSRSTKSSASRDESDYRKSATTRTTRSGSGGDDENVTIKVTGTARVMVGGAQIDCPDGGEIEIKRQQKSLRNGSEQSVSEFGEQKRIDDRRSRVDRPSGRSRISSQHSYTRPSPQYLGENYF
ncbi:hypothetical protein G7Y89_g2781 [Cudoniella acicularis]|uniref:Uncharacterized protein n=1 Tax=Cudoniella acicularis TaxID=354080 RepID=A0A8H4W920_9HELO|nr:hypothetical protein G7Y89_g2781 [Cudoniella acicularis]